MTALTIRTHWLPQAIASELDATMCELTILNGDKNVTEYTASRNGGAAFLQIPAYFLAEWIAENWWALLHEPEKNEEGGGADYRERHSLLSAQHGFALPNLTIVPVGRAIHLSTSYYVAKLAGAVFERVATADAPREEIEEVLGGFVTSCVEVLEQHGYADTPLRDAWNLVRGTDQSQQEFCRLIGALGLSPYNVDDQIADIIDLLIANLGSGATRDLCLAAIPDTLTRIADGARRIAALIDSAPVSDIASLSSMALGPDNFNAAGWCRGLNAAQMLAKEFHMSSENPSGADEMFRRLEVQPFDAKNPSMQSVDNLAELPFNCAIRREAFRARLAIMPSDEAQRRFAAARAIYLAWVSEDQSQRLVTTALTRDQQASRQFAAEILVPRAHLEKQAGKLRRLSHDQVREIAWVRRASPLVVIHQANNSGIRVGSI